MKISLVLLMLTIKFVYSGRRHCFYMKSIDTNLTEFLDRPVKSNLEEFFRNLAAYYSALDKLLKYLNEKKLKYMFDCKYLSQNKTPLFLTKRINISEFQYYCKNNDELFVLIKTYIRRINETYKEFLSACSENPQFLGKPEPPEYLVDICGKALNHLFRHPIKKPDGFYQLFNNMSLYFKNLQMLMWSIRNRPVKHICEKAHQIRSESNYDFLEKPLDFEKIKREFQLNDYEFMEFELKMERIQKRWKDFKDVYYNTFVERTTVISFATEFHVEERVEYSGVDYEFKVTEPETTALEIENDVNKVEDVTEDLSLEEEDVTEDLSLEEEDVTENLN